MSCWLLQFRVESDNQKRVRIASLGQTHAQSLVFAIFFWLLEISIEFMFMKAESELCTNEKLCFYPNLFLISVLDICK